MPRTRLEFDQANDAEFASQLELEQVQDNNAIPALFDPLLMNNYALYQLANAAYNAASDSNFSFFNPSGAVPYIEINNVTYSTFSSFIFRGTNIWTPTTVYLIASRSKATGSSFIRIVDYTNGGNIIVEHEFTEQAETLYTNISTPTNLPTGLAIFEFQARQSANQAGSPQIWAVGMYP